MTGDYKRQRAEKVGICRNQQSNKEPKNTDFTESVELSGKRKRKADGSEPDESVGRVGSQEYLVEKILGTQIAEGTREYFVKWLGWDSSYNSWEPEENMTGCQEMVQEFMKKENQKATLNKVSLRTSVAVNDVIPQEGQIANRDKLYKIPQTGDIKPIVVERKMNVSKVSISSNEKSAVNDANSISRSNGIGITQTAVATKAPITISKPVMPTVKVGLVNPQKQMKILQQKNVITVDANFIIKANDNIKFEFVVTTKLDRNIQKIYNQSILSSDGNVYVLCEFEGSNLIEVVPKSFFKSF